MPGSKASKAAVPPKALVDTHTLVWALSEPELLSEEARRALAASEVVASVASLWELLLKRGKPGALLAEPLPWWDKFVIRAGIQVIGIRQTHVMALGHLPDHHRDPFDRILVAQAMVEKAALVSKDGGLAVYGITVVW
ncbi:MAG: type II toxin-antitoxin system VapC family toxin [Bryobacteraceae bacterium]